MAENRRKSAVSTYLLLFVLALVFAAAAVLLLPVYRSYQKKQAELGTLNEQLNDKRDESARLNTEVGVRFPGVPAGESGRCGAPSRPEWISVRTVVKYFTFSAFFLLHLTNRFLYYRKDVSQVFFPRPARPGTGSAAN